MGECIRERQLVERAQQRMVDGLRHKLRMEPLVVCVKIALQNWGRA